MRKKSRFMSMMITVVLLVTPMYASAQEAGNYRKGLFYYKQTCQHCHTLKEIGDGKTKQSHEQCITEKAWIESFQQKKFDMIGCKEIEKELCLMNLKHIYTYLHTPAEAEPDVTNCRVISTNKVGYNK